MLVYSLKRLGLAILVALIVSAIVFVLVRAAADPAVAIAGEGAQASDIEAIRKREGFDRSLAVQYAEWLGRMLAGDLGQSYRLHQPVTRVLLERIPVTVTLAGVALLFALLLSFPLGIAAALRPNSWIDRIALTLSVLGQALPTFWFALIMIILFGVTLRWLPISGTGTWMHYVMPAIALGYYATPAFMRLIRAEMIEVLASDYIRFAKAKGLRAGPIIIKHGLRNAVIPVVGLAATQFGFMLGGSVVIETIFAMHGLGYLAWESITRADLPVIQALVLVISFAYCGLTLLADLINAWLDPRLRIA